MTRRAAIPACITAIALLAAGIVGAVSDTTLSIAKVVGENWTAEGLTITLDLSGAQPRVHLEVRKFTVASSPKIFSAIKLDCGELRFAGPTVSCDKARLSAIVPGLGAQSLAGRGEWRRDNGSLALDAQGLVFGSGGGSVSVELANQRWRSKLDLRAVPLEEVLRVAGAWSIPLPQSTGTGRLSLQGEISGDGATLMAARLDASVENLTLNNEAGTLASDKLNVKVHAEVHRTAAAWAFDAAVNATQGQAYAQPIFLDFGAHALSLAAAGEFGEDRHLRLDTFNVSHAGVANARGAATLAFGSEHPLQSLNLDLRELVFPGAYESYLQPLLLDTDLKALKTSGRVNGGVVIAGGEPRAFNLHLEKLGADDGGGKFLIDQLSGDLNWVAQPPGATDSEAERDVAGVAGSKLHWSRATFLRLEFGAADFDFVTLGRQFRLLAPVRVALFDGAVHLDSLRVRNAGTPDISFLVDAEIEPVNVRRLCHAFGWPEFGGSIGGKISKLRMRDGVATVGTALEAEVFAGKLGLNDVRLEDPFGQWPRFFGNVAFDDLDLALVTDAFSFGRITGKLSGRIANLQLFNWTPVAFDAQLATPPNDRSPHRISQRAVQNLGSLGGGGAGVTAALSGGLLKFFQDFNYDRLGLTCTLRNDVCLMGGVAPAKHGYYLVKGKGVPRIDVIGSETRVDWPRLVAQLIAITHSSGPVVQ